MRTKVVAPGLLAVGVIALGIVSGCGNEGTADAAGLQTSSPRKIAAGDVAVTLGQGKEFSVAVAPQGTAGKIDFVVRNAGALDHEFVVVRTDEAAPDLGTDEADEAGAVDEIQDLPAGATKLLSVTLPAGHYVLLCNLPGHYVGGMYADFTVK